MSKTKNMMLGCTAAALVWTVASVALAGSGLIPCNGADCTIESFFKLLDNIINWMLMVMVPLGAIGFAWAGFLIMFSGGNQGQVAKGKGMMVGVLIGMLFMLFAYIGVKAFLQVLA